MSNFKKKFALFVFCIFFSVILLNACGGEKLNNDHLNTDTTQAKEDKTTSDKENKSSIDITVDKKNLPTEKQSKNLQSSLILLNSLYMRAVTLTNASLHADPKNVSFEEWQNLTEQSVLAWEALETELDLMGLIVEDIEMARKQGLISKNNNLNSVDSFLIDSALQNSNTQNSFLTELISIIPDLGNSFLMKTAYGAAPDPALVTAVFDSNPESTNNLKDLMNYFGWDARTALEQLKMAQAQIESAAWDEEGDTHEILQNQAKIVLDTSKVTLMIGGMAITGGASAPMSTGAAIFSKGSLVINGADLAMALTEDGMIIAGSENGQAVVKKYRDKLSGTCRVLSIVGLSDVTNPENLITLTELGTEYGDQVIDWASTDTRANLDMSGGRIDLSNSDLSGDLPAINPKDLERYNYNATKEWRTFDLPDLLEEAEKWVREEKNRVDLEVNSMKQDLALYLEQKEQLLYDIEMLRSMSGGSFSRVDRQSLDLLYKQLSTLNKDIEDLDEMLEEKEGYSESLEKTLDDNFDENSEDEKDKEQVSEYPEILNASGTWKNNNTNGTINLSFPSAGGSLSGSFSNCSTGECWSSTAKGNFNGEDAGTVSGTISGSGSSPDNGIYYSISGDFSGVVNLSGGTASGTFSTNTHIRGNTYPDSGTWHVSFNTENN
ncbi:hypothetical protein GF354_02875 [Candidatus Peregrinibacteria bacterium]|nr:hypothetical protein [Candidatus Peregrinibacteria bacterium]